MKLREWTPKEIELFNKAKKAIDAEDYKTALKLTDNLLKINPENPFFYFVRGEYYDAMYDIDEYLVCYEKALEHRDKGYLSEDDISKLQKDITNLKRRTQTPKEEAVFETAVVAVESGDYTKALSIIEGLLKVKHYHPLYYYALGLCQGQLGQYSEALSSYKRALEYEGKQYSMEVGFRETVVRGMNELSLACKANILFSARKYEDAIDFLDGLLEMYPNSGKYYFMRGMCNELTGAIIAAKKDYKKALEHGLENVEMKRIAEDRARPETKPQTENLFLPMTVFMKEEE
ncbi:tetratricopeptide repeat protein, partial [Chloroflexota bacterium]